VGDAGADHSTLNQQSRTDMGKVNLADEHVDPALERKFLASLAESPGLYWEHDPNGRLFPSYEQAFQDVRGAIEAGEDVPPVPDDWEPASDPTAALQRLRSAWKRRETAAVQELLSNGIGGQRSIEETLDAAGDRLAKIEGELREDTAGTLQYPGDLMPEVLSTAKEARERVQAGGDALPGVRSGIDPFDEITGGFQEGLSIIGGGPGVGKTTLALQMAAHAAEHEAPALYVTYENSPEGLALKGTCATAGLSPQAVRRGQVPTKKVQAAAKRWKEKARRLAFVEGTAELRTGQIRGKAKRHMARFDADRCLIALDYLQLYAKRAEQFGHLSDQRERVQAAGNAIRAVGMGLRSPVLAIASQSRKAGNYGGDDAQENETGSARMDSLKESGDLEYSADAVAFLTPPISNPDRASRTVEPNRAVELTVAKNRHGETGRVELVFRQAEGTMMPEAKHNETPQGEVAGNSPGGAPGGNGAPSGDGSPF
jgi:replicative DNA helicase